MTKSTVFRTNKTQAVRLPKSAALPDHVKRVDVIRKGSGRLIVPAGGGWDEFFNGSRIDGDFLDVRDQPPPQERGRKA